MGSWYTSEAQYLQAARARFLTNVEPEPNSGCHLWIGCRDPNGYGRFSFRCQGRLAHRVAWELFTDVDVDPIQVLHRCDTPPCVNRAHHFFGDPGANMQDMVQKGRYGIRVRRCGEAHHHSKLTASMVREIRTTYALGGVSLKTLGRQYGTYPSNISLIVRKIGWAHVDAE